MRYAHAHLRHLFPYLSQQPGYNKRLRRAAGLIRHCVRVLAASSTAWTDDIWVVDSLQSNAAAPRDTVRRSDWPDVPNTGTAPLIHAGSGGCGCTWSVPCTAFPVAFALTGAKADEREVLLAMFTAEPGLATSGPGRS